MDKSKYPVNWQDISRRRRHLAGDRCEWVEIDGKRCPHKNGDLAIGRNGKEYSIVLTTAHLDHDPSHNDMDNLRSWCQKHHLRYDAPHHAKSAAATRLRKKSLSALEAYGNESPLFKIGEM
jgi:hypothetical protein